MMGQDVWSEHSRQGSAEGIPAQSRGFGCPYPQHVAVLSQDALEQFGVPVPIGGGQCWSWDMVHVSLASARDEALHRVGSSHS